MRAGRAAACNRAEGAPPAAERPARGFSKAKTAMQIIAVAMTSGIAREGTNCKRKAPRAEASIVKLMSAGSRSRGKTRLLRKGSDPPKLRKTRASILVATETRGLIPNCIITGTVMSDVPPVTTLMTAVKKKTTIKQIRDRADMQRLSFPAGVAAAGGESSSRRESAG